MLFARPVPRRWGKGAQAFVRPVSRRDAGVASYRGAARRAWSCRRCGCALAGREVPRLYQNGMTGGAVTTELDAGALRGPRPDLQDAGVGEASALPGLPRRAVDARLGLQVRDGWAGFE